MSASREGHGLSRRSLRPAIDPRQGCLERALEVLREVVGRVRGGHFGLLRTRVYRSRDGKALATHAEWKSTSQHDAVLRDDECVRRFNRLRELGIYESHVYEMTDDICAIAPAAIGPERPRCSH